MCRDAEIAVDEAMVLNKQAITENALQEKVLCVHTPNVVIGPFPCFFCVCAAASTAELLLIVMIPTRG